MQDFEKKNRHQKMAIEYYSVYFSFRETKNNRKLTHNAKIAMGKAINTAFITIWMSSCAPIVMSDVK